MRISELADQTGVPLATLKFYLREGLLEPGVALSATRAEYGDDHVRRVRIIRALTDTVGLSVQQARVLLRLIDEPGTDLAGALGSAMAVLPPAVTEAAGEDHPHAKAVLDLLGWVYDPAYPAVAQLEQSLAAAESAGIPLDRGRLTVYGRAIREIAEFDVRRVAAGTDSSLEYAILATALYEPVIAALRRLAHRDIGYPQES